MVETVYDGTQFQISSSRAPGALPSGFKNWLINGGMEVWQRSAGDSPSSIAITASTTAYLCDRFYLITGANQACHAANTPSDAAKQ